MPLTPFHFGPGALIHSAAPRHVSFLAFWLIHRPAVARHLANFLDWKELTLRPVALDAVSLSTLHWGCVAAGVVGLAVLGVRWDAR